MNARCRLAPALLLLAGPALAADGPGWLERMDRALASTSYVGEFVCESAGRSEKLRILHRVRDGQVRERLISLSGHGRELVRKACWRGCIPRGFRRAGNELRRRPIMCGGGGREAAWNDFFESAWRARSARAPVI